MIFSDRFVLASSASTSFSRPAGVFCVIRGITLGARKVHPDFPDPGMTAFRIVETMAYSALERIA